MAHIDVLTKDDGFPSDFTHKRVSDALDRKGEVLAYMHLLLGWMKPKSAYLAKLVTENAKDVIGWGYQVNFKIMDILNPQGGLIGEIGTIAADVVLFSALKDYADTQSRKNKTDPKTEYMKLLAIMAMPFGMLILVGMAVYDISSQDWGKILDPRTYIRSEEERRKDIPELREIPFFTDLMRWLGVPGTPPKQP